MSLVVRSLSVRYMLIRCVVARNTPPQNRRSRTMVTQDDKRTMVLDSGVRMVL